jgi:hypothetical protein
MAVAFGTGGPATGLPTSPRHWRLEFLWGDGGENLWRDVGARGGLVASFGLRAGSPSSPKCLALPPGSSIDGVGLSGVQWGRAGSPGVP